MAVQPLRERWEIEFLDKFTRKVIGTADPLGSLKWFQQGESPENVIHYIKKLIEERIVTFSRNSVKNGRNTLINNQFLAICKNKESAEYHNLDYVVMSRKRYDQIMKDLYFKQNTKKIQILDERK